MSNAKDILNNIIMPRKNQYQQNMNNQTPCALEWWNKLPDYGPKGCTFDKCRFGSKGGLTKIYHSDRFSADLTDSEILEIYTIRFLII